jgi:hypothetical protein
MPVLLFKNIRREKKMRMPLRVRKYFKGNVKLSYSTGYLRITFHRYDDKPSEKIILFYTDAKKLSEDIDHELRHVKG